MSDNKNLATQKILPWTGGIVPFSFATSFQEEEKQLIRRVITRLTELLKVKTLHGPRYAVMFVEKPTSYSATSHCRFGKAVNQSSVAGIGMPKRKVYTSLLLSMRNNIPDGEILHELCHVLGLVHEHCRPDRDLYVSVRPTNPRFNENEIIPREEFVDAGILNLAYDCNSIMHYGTTFGVVPHNAEAVSPQQGETLTTIDIEKLHLVYPPRYTLQEMRQHGAVLEESEVLRNPQPLHTPSFDEVMATITLTIRRQREIQKQLDSLSQWPSPLDQKDELKKEYEFLVDEEYRLKKKALGLCCHSLPGPVASIPSLLATLQKK